MKIVIKAIEHNLSLWLPTRIIFSKSTAWIANSIGRRYATDAMKDLSPEALEMLFDVMRQIKNKHHTWELVSIESATGETVKIIL